MYHQRTCRRSLFALPAILLFTMVGCSGTDLSLPQTDLAESGAIPSLTPPLATQEQWNREAYDAIKENGFRSTLHHPLSTFSIDVDTASYANVRRFLRSGQLPPAGAVRIEELVNYFSYDYPEPATDQPIGVSVEVADCPWAPGHQLARIAMKAREIPVASRPPSNLVFLLDVSGSMNDPYKLPLVKDALNLLVDRLDERDRVAIVVYAGAVGLALPSTSGEDKAAIRSALTRLDAGGSTNGGDGIRLAYDVASEHFISGGVNRVLLCTDGDFNIGTTSQSDLVELIKAKAESGVFLSVLGVGTGNYQDSTMEKLADQGNGNYAYLDSVAEARKVLVEQMSGTLTTVAKDVKLQVDFNPAEVGAYRLLGYENRMLKSEEFADDRKDAGEVGAGHRVTAFYELVPPSEEVEGTAVVDSRYQARPQLSPAAQDGELLTVRVRYKEPEGTESRRFEVAAHASPRTFPEASVDFRFAAAVVEFGLLLRDSQYAGNGGWDHVIATASAGLTDDLPDEVSKYRYEFIELAAVARQLSGSPSGPRPE